jgi:hypothetical protein
MQAILFKNGLIIITTKAHYYCYPNYASYLTIYCPHSNIVLKVIAGWTYYNIASI